MDVTAVVATTNIPVLEPAATLTVAGTTIAFDVVLSLTEIVPLPVPGVALSVTVPLAFDPPTTVEGLIVSEDIWNGLTVIDPI